MSKKSDFFAAGNCWLIACNNQTPLSLDAALKERTKKTSGQVAEKGRKKGPALAPTAL